MPKLSHFGPEMGLFGWMAIRRKSTRRGLLIAGACGDSKNQAEQSVLETNALYDGRNEKAFAIRN
jgi:hypothetical protein